MFVRVKPKRNGKKSIQIVASHRRADKVAQKIVRHVGQAVTVREVEELKKLAYSIIVEMQRQLPLFAPENLSRKEKLSANESVCVKDLREEQRVIDGIGDVFGKLYDDLGLSHVIAGSRKDQQWNSVLRALVMARIANPASKLRTAALLEEDYGIKVPLEKLYRTMDHVVDRELAIKKRISQTTLSLFNEEVDVLFFDVTTLYFESVQSDDLRNFGFSKDKKFNEVQVVLALVTTTRGLPITYELFPGNIYEGHTLVSMIESIQMEHNVRNVLFVADRAMFTEENLLAMEQLGVTYIVAAKLRSMPKRLKSELLNSKYSPGVVGGEFQWINEFEYKSRRLIVAYSSNRARKDATDRQRLITRLMKKVKNGKIRLKELLPNYGSKKYVTIENDTATLNQERIEHDAQWDGLHGVITNSSEKKLVEILCRYRELWQIEEAFRISKHDLKMRPIYHWTEKRIKAHVAICYIAYALAKHAVYRVSLQQESMSFEHIRNELLHAQSSIVRDLESKKKFVIPSNLTVSQKKIYQTFGIKRSDLPYAIT